MKTKTQLKKSNFHQFLKNEIKKPEVIQGGKNKGPIERDKLRRPRHG